VAAKIRRILHIDMDAFYASIEQRDNPPLHGLPVVVGGQPDERGVVAASSYEARAFGVRSAMPMARAIRLCPSLRIVRPDFAKYRAVSAQVFAIFRQATPLVEPLSLDEAYLDVTENAWGEELGMNVARRLKNEIKAETGLTASAGVAPNKFLAKIASGWQKPDGLTVIAPSRVEPFLRSLPIDALWGVGPVTAGKLRAIGLERLVDIRKVDQALLRQAIGSSADWLMRLAAGDDDRPVVPDRPRKSVGTETTFVRDLTDISRIRGEIEAMVAECVSWLARKERCARTVTLKVRYEGFVTITRSHSAAPTREPGELTARATALLDRTEAGARPVRLLGVSLHGLTDTRDAPTIGEPAPRLPFDPD
jgi:DNA polymerase-4